MAEASAKPRRKTVVCEFIAEIPNQMKAKRVCYVPESGKHSPVPRRGDRTGMALL